MEYGPVRREHVAEVLVQALSSEAATGRTLEVFSSDGSPVRDWASAFAALSPDVPQALDGVQDPANLPVDHEPVRVQADLQRRRGRQAHEGH